MLIPQRLPSIVSNDLIDWMAKTGIQHMNKFFLQDFQKETDFGEIELDIGNDLFNLLQLLE